MQFGLPLLQRKDKGKVVPLCNEPPCHIGIWGRGGIAPCFLNLATRYRWLAKSMLQLLYPMEAAPDTYWKGEWVNPRVILDVLSNRIISSPCQRLNRSPDSSLIVVLTPYHSSQSLQVLTISTLLPLIKYPCQNNILL